jgi:hypothetical protein
LFVSKYYINVIFEWIKTEFLGTVMAIRPGVPPTYDRCMLVEYGGVIIPRKTELL